jgi:hypothetical protein
MMDVLAEKTSSCVIYAVHYSIGPGLRAWDRSHEQVCGPRETIIQGPFPEYLILHHSKEGGGGRSKNIYFSSFIVKLSTC